MDMLIVVVVLIIITVITFIVVYKRVSPAEALVISGFRGKRVVCGGGSIIIPRLELPKILSMRIMTVDIVRSGIYTKPKIPINVEGVFQFKVKNEKEHILKAAQCFLDLTIEQIQRSVTETLDGHLRGVCASMTPEEINDNREAFQQEVTKATLPDLVGMGIEILSLTIKAISDEQSYLTNLGKPQQANIRKVAEIAQAEADKLIAEKWKDTNVNKAKFTQETKHEEAKADIAFDLSKREQENELKKREMAILLTEREKQVDIQQKEIERKEREGEAIRRYDIKVAEGRAQAMRVEGEGEADKIKAVKTAEAVGIKAMLLAEAEGLEKKATAYRHLNEAGLTVMLFQQFPDMVKAAAEGMSKVGNVTVIQTGGDGKAVTSPVTQGVIDIVSSIPPILQAFGIDIKELIEKAKSGGLSKGDLDKIEEVVKKTTRDAKKS